MPKLAVTYFDAPGRAEPIRIALHLAGLAFEDRRLSFAQFQEKKASGGFPLGSVPVLSIDDVDYPQTAAILRYVARIGNAGLYPTDPHEALIVDAVLDSFNDTLAHALTPSLFERDIAKKLEMRKAVVAGPMAIVYGFLEKTLTRSGGPFVVGAAMSIADLVIAQQVLQIRDGRLDGIGAAELEPYPRIRALAEAYLADARIAAHAKH